MCHTCATLQPLCHMCHTLWHKASSMPYGKTYGKILCHPATRYPPADTYPQAFAIRSYLKFCARYPAADTYPLALPSYLTVLPLAFTLTYIYIRQRKQITLNVYFHHIEETTIFSSHSEKRRSSY